MAVHLFVPRWMDQANTNAQNSNARALLSRFSDPRARWTAICSEKPADCVRRSAVETVCVSRSRWWQYRLFLSYQSKFDAVFYPGPHWSDEVGLKIRNLSGRRRPIIATLEGIIASPESLQRLSTVFGHPVFAQPGTDANVPRLRWLYEGADHIIAISPFLARVARALYGDKVSCLPLGLETEIFHARDRREPARCRVVGCGTVKSSKNPQAFLSLAARYPQVDFVWFGDGPTRPQLTDEGKARGLGNLSFAGALEPGRLAQEFRRSSIFVLPSRAEGVPKVTQEAAACGLPVVLNGFFEAPSVIHQHNGLVAWSDEELSEHVRVLIDNPAKRTQMGRHGAAMAAEWDWDRVAPQWEDLVIRLATSIRA